MIFFFFFETRQLISLILNSKRAKDNFLENWSKIATVRVRQHKGCKMAAMTSSISNFQNPRKTDLTNICQIICRKFHQNAPIRLGCSASILDTHTFTYTHPRFIATYSNKMTEYKNSYFLQRFRFIYGRLCV